MTDRILPSWRDGAARDAIVAFIDRVDEIPVEDRVAVFDNDGTMWCEKPNYTQLEFFLVEMKRAIQADPALADRAEYRALIDHDHEALEALGLEGVAMALLDLFAGQTPEEFAARVAEFFAEHPPVVVGEEAPLLAHLTWLPSFHSVDDARVRDNRLRLLGEIADTVNGIAHFHQLGTKSQSRDPSPSV